MHDFSLSELPDASHLVAKYIASGDVARVIDDESGEVLLTGASPSPNNFVLPQFDHEAELDELLAERRASRHLPEAPWLR